jgi:hypothetical protein
MKFAEIEMIDLLTSNGKFWYPYRRTFSRPSCPTLLKTLSTKASSSLKSACWFGSRGQLKKMCFVDWDRKPHWHRRSVIPVKLREYKCSWPFPLQQKLIFRRQWWWKIWKIASFAFFLIHPVLEFKNDICAARMCGCQCINYWWVSRQKMSNVLVPNTFFLFKKIFPFMAGMLTTIVTAVWRKELSLKPTEFDL